MGRMVKSFKMDSILRPIDDSTNPLLEDALRPVSQFSVVQPLNLEPRTLMLRQR